MEALSPATKLALNMFQTNMNQDLQDAQQKQKELDDKEIQEQQLP